MKLLSAKSLFLSISLAGVAGLALLQSRSLKPSTEATLPPAYFAKPISLGEGREWRMYPVVADFDGDGKLDIAATFRRPLYENSLFFWRGSGDFKFSALAQTWSSPGYSGLAAGDIDRNGKVDLVAASHFSRFQTYLTQDWGAGKFRELVAPASDGYIVARLADLDGDGQLELVLLGNEKAGVEVYAWSGDNGWKLRTRFADGKIGRDLRIVDMDGDTKPDIVALMVHRGVQIFLQRDNFSFQPGPATDFFSATKDFRSMQVEDLNSDGKPDIVLNGGYAGVLKPNGPDVYLNDDKGGWIESNKGLKVFKAAGEGIAIADFDHDGIKDLVVGANSTGAIDQKAYGLFMFKGDSHGAWTLVSASGLPASGLARNYGISAADLNADGLFDLVAAHGAPEEGSGYISIWPALKHP